MNESTRYISERIIPLDKGDYQTGYPYAVMDMVTHKGSSYISRTNNNTSEPSRTNPEWRLIAQGYEGGGTGAPGASITIDSELSDTSPNPVENKTISRAISELNRYINILIDAVNLLNANDEVVGSVNNRIAYALSQHGDFGEYIEKHTKEYEALIKAITDINTEIELLQNSSNTGGVQSDWNETDETSLAYIKNKPTIPTDVEGIIVDSALSMTSTNAVQNKIITNELIQKQATIADLETIRSGAAKGATAVQPIEGKGLSTEDFTTALKNKLNELKNYDDTTLTAAIESLRQEFNTLVSGDTSTAIDNYNNIIAFLSGIEDSQKLDSIIASIEQQIATKQATIADLETIRQGAAKGMTAIQEHQSLTNYATKTYVSEVIASAITTTLNTAV